MPSVRCEDMVEARNFMASDFEISEESNKNCEFCFFKNTKFSKAARKQNNAFVRSISTLVNCDGNQKLHDLGFSNIYGKVIKFRILLSRKFNSLKKRENEENTSLLPVECWGTTDGTIKLETVNNLGNPTTRTKNAIFSNFVFFHNLYFPKGLLFFPGKMGIR